MIYLEELNKNKIGLILGFLFAIIHFVWSVFVAVFPSGLQSFLDWIFKLHFLNSIYTLTTFNFVNAILLIVVTFVVGYIIGWVFAALWNKMHFD